MRNGRASVAADGSGADLVLQPTLRIDESGNYALSFSVTDASTGASVWNGSLGMAPAPLPRHVAPPSMALDGGPTGSVPSQPLFHEDERAGTDGLVDDDGGSVPCLAGPDEFPTGNVRNAGKIAENVFAVIHHDERFVLVE